MPEAVAEAVTAVALPKIVVVLAAGLAPGAAANIAACLAAGLTAARPGWAGQSLVDAAGLASAASSHLPITILRADPDPMRSLLAQLAAAASEPDSVVSLFPAYAQAMHGCEAYWQRHRETAHAEEPMLGIGLHGPKRWVTRLTGSLPLWR